MPIVLENEYIPKNTAMFFRQSNSPIGWTKDLSYHDYTMRLINGSVGSSAGGSFSGKFGLNFSFSWSAATLSSSQIALHTHGIRYDTGGNFGTSYLCHNKATNSQTGTDADTVNTYVATGGTTSVPTGATVPTAGSHNHTSTITTAVNYIDFIICIKD